MQIKLTCGCGTKYKFDVEPINGRMPTHVQCPSCGNDGTFDAEAIIARTLGQSVGQPPAPAAPAGSSGLRLSRPFQAEATSHAGGYSSAQTAQSGGASLLDRRTFFVKERVAVLKMTDVYDILDPATSQPIGIAKEEPPVWAKWLRLLINKQLMPTTVNIYEHEGHPPVVTVHRGFTFLRSKITVTGDHGASLGYFKSKLLSIGGGFFVFNNQDQQIAEVKGNWKGWDFKFLNKGGREIGSVTKKWAGLGRELFTSADNYIISLSDSQTATAENTALLLAAGISIDIVFKESK